MLDEVDLPADPGRHPPDPFGGFPPRRYDHVADVDVFLANGARLVEDFHLDVPAVEVRARLLSDRALREKRAQRAPRAMGRAHDADAVATSLQQFRINGDHARPPRQVERRNDECDPHISTEPRSDNRLAFSTVAWTGRV